MLQFALVRLDHVNAFVQRIEQGSSGGIQDHLSTPSLDHHRNPGIKVSRNALRQATCANDVFAVKLADPIEEGLPFILRHLRSRRGHAKLMSGGALEYRSGKARMALDLDDPSVEVEVVQQLGQ